MRAMRRYYLLRTYIIFTIYWCFAILTFEGQTFIHGFYKRCIKQQVLRNGDNTRDMLSFTSVWLAAQITTQEYVNNSKMSSDDYFKMIKKMMMKMMIGMIACAVATSIAGRSNNI